MLFMYSHLTPEPQRKNSVLRHTRRHTRLGDSVLTLALATSRPTNHACLHRGGQLIWVLLPVALLDLCRLGVVAAAVLAAAALPPVLAEATAAAQSLQ